MRALLLLLVLASCTGSAPPPPPPPGPEVGGCTAEPTPVPTEGPGVRGTCAKDEECRATGCSATLCASQDVLSTCEYRPEHDCFREPTTSCGCFEGRCAWAPTEELKACLQKVAPAR